MDITHPGTPLQVLIAGIIRVFNLGCSSVEAVNHALLNPEFYLNAVYVFLTLCSFATSVFLASYVYRKTKDKYAAILTQVPALSFLIMPSFDSGTYPVIPVIANISAEPVFMVLMNLFNLSVMGLYFAHSKPCERRHVLFLAVICGIGLATKINFLIILFAAFLVVPNRKKILFALVCVAAFVFSTIPIIAKYPQLFHWISDMVGHSSRYGTGSAAFIDWNSFLFYFKLMMSTDWFFILSALGLWTWSSFCAITERQNRATHFVWALSLCCLLQMAATAKHFSFHYLLPAFGLFSSMLPLFYLNQKDRFKALKPLAAGFIIVFLSTCLFYTIPYYKRLSELTRDIRQFNAKIKANYPACTVVPASTGDVDIFLNPQMVLQRANGTNFRLEADDLFRLYPNSYYFFSEEVTSPDPRVESYGLWNFKQRVFADDILNSCPCAIFIKYGPDFSSYPYQVRLIDHSKYLNAYLLINSTEKLANALFSKAMEASKNGDFEQALMLGLKARELNYQPRGELDYILTIIYREVMKSRPSLLNQRQ